jgi:hypothetical protein
MKAPLKPAISPLWPNPRHFDGANQQIIASNVNPKVGTGIFAIGKSGVVQSEAGHLPLS